MSESSPLIEGEIRVYPKRWAVLGIFCLYGLCNQIQYTTFTTIVRQVQAFYDVSAASVNMLAALFPLVYVLGVFPGCKVYDKVGIRGGILAGTTVNFIGSLLKIVTSLWYPQYWVLCVAQVFNAGGQVFFQSLPPLVASTWFAEDERTLATALGALAGYVGMATGMFYSPRVVTKDDASAHQFNVLFASQAALAGAAWLLTVIFVDNKPPTSPSFTATDFGGGLEVTKTLKALIKKRDLVMLTIGLGIVTGLLTAIASVMAQFLEPMGVSEVQTGVIAFAALLSGAFNCGVVGPLVDKYRKYKVPLLIIYGSVVVLSVVVCTLIKTLHGDFVPWAYITIILFCLLTLPSVPVAMELGVEMAYPEPPSIASSFIIGSLCLFSVIGTVAYSAILGNHPTRDDSFTLMAVTGACVACAFGMTMFVRERLERREAEKSLSASPTSPPAKDFDEGINKA